MHATTEQLLSLRDGQPVSAAAAAHVRACARCRRELARFERTRSRLRALPELQPPGGLWRTVAVNAVKKPVRTRWRWAVAAGCAASFLLGMTLVLRFGPGNDPGPQPGTTTDLIAATPAPASSVNGATTGELLDASRQLEAALRAMPAAPRLTRASTAVTIADLQDRLFEIDAQLSAQQLDPTKERTLWEQRVNLMDTLMQVRYAQLSELR
jgi:hypothetical protein